MSRVLPSRFYTADPADLADELMAARQRDTEYQAKQALQRAMEPDRRDHTHRHIGTVAKRARIKALVAAVKKGKA
jgi:hypothetical protein